MQVVSTAWNGAEKKFYSFDTLIARLKAVKQALRTWNKEVFGNVQDAISEAEARVCLAEQEFDSNPSEANRMDMSAAHAQLRRTLLNEEKMWCKKSRMEWMQNGDRNTAFYQAVVKNNRRRNYIHRLKIHGSNIWCEDQDILKGAAYTYFEDLLTSEHPTENAELLQAPVDLIPRIKAQTGYKNQEGALSYLGIPITPGRTLVSHYKHIIDRITGSLAAWKSKLLSQAGRIVLINSVLCSIPIYTASASCLPKSVIHIIERHCASFFWNGADGPRRRQWVSWGNIMRPKQEGGLGVRSLWHVQVSLMAKLIWNAMTGTSLWSKYARSRFHITTLSNDTKAFPTGISKDVYSAAKTLLMQNTRWILGDGKDIDFLHYRWAGSSPLITTLPHLSQQPFYSVSDVVSDDSHPLRCTESIRQILDKVKLSNYPDKCVWTASANGSFSTSSAFQAIRPRGIPRPPLLNIWHNAYNSRAALFGWRVLHRAIPTDDRVSACGIHIVSKYSCCIIPATEDMDHLFLYGEITSSLWRWARPLIRNSAFGSHISITLWNVLSRSNRQSAFDFISVYAVLLVLWEIWKYRCAKRHDSKAKSLNGILSDIKYAINIAVQSINFKRSCSRIQLRTLLHYDFTPTVKMKKPSFVRWTPPQTGLYLNVDSASKGNPSFSGGGGCIRDSNGCIRLGFAFFYGQGDSLTAETRALYDGLRLADQHGFHISNVFFDSLVLVQSFKTNRCPSWKCTWWWREASSPLRESSVQLHHVYRETNRVADALAVYACNIHGSSIFHSLSSLPSVCKGPTALDKTGLPSVRLL
ncbi:hypothetical protein Taro_040548 [Colocasia esculenta]|uniref:RNase H type-1 domain-containing protein n=1 Tax=Colocasia esculenta TaxID=4460 RepID=A0A843WJ12_COLES|nr:hypothetical protein [Colocasia esculenta]